MSTKKTEITSTTTTDNKVSDNKAVFGPLGKYAVVAVIMVSIIVTTAIVLDKELGTAEEKLATAENEVAAANAVDEETAAKVETGPVNAQAVDAETAEVQADNSKVIVAIKANETIATVKETVADSSSYTEQTSNAVPAISTQTTAKIESARTDTKAKNSFQERQSQSVANNQYKQWLSRIEVYKLEQKQHMTERLTRIKSLESEQLDQYKVRQKVREEKQIDRLREQIAQQQQVIETLILRNQERFDMRAASMQRHQARREQMLNRI